MLLFVLSLVARAQDPVAAGRVHLDPVGAAELEGEAHGWPGGTIVRYRQRAHGLPIHGRPLAVSIGRDGRVRRSAGRPATRIERQDPRIDAAEAVARAREVGARLGQGELWAPIPRLAWLDRPDGTRLAWKVDLSTATPVGTWRTWIDARTGEIVSTDWTSRSARAEVYPISPLLSDLSEVVLPGLPEGALTLDGDYVSAASCDDWEIEDGWFGVTACHSASAHAVADEAGDFWFAPDPGGLDDPLAEVQAYYHVDFVSAWLDDRYGFRHADPIRSVVNFPLANAFFGDFDGDGQGDVSFGHDEGSGVDFAYDADVVYHEFGHSVVAALADLPFLRADDWGMDWVAGAINEGYADALSMALTVDPRTGEYAGSAFELAAIRDLSRDRRCPDDLVGEVHADGEILGALAWNLVERIGPEATHDVLFGALPFWGADVSWPVVGQTLLDSAGDLVDAGALAPADRDVVAEEVERSNLLACGRVLPLDDGRTTTQYLLNLGLDGDLAQIPLGLQLSIEVPADATSAEIEITGVQGDPGLGWAVYGRSGHHVEHDVVTIDGLGLAVARPEVHDWAIDGEGADVITLTRDGDPPLVPGRTLYLAIASRNLGSIDPFDPRLGTIGVRASTSSEALPQEEGPAGCGCASAPGVPGLGGLGLVALGVIGRRRRRDPIGARSRAVRQV